MRKPGSIYDYLQERVYPEKLYKELEEQYPSFNEQIKNITREDVKKKRKVWTYGKH